MVDSIHADIIRKLVSGEKHYWRTINLSIDMLTGDSFGSAISRIYPKFLACSSALTASDALVPYMPSCLADIVLGYMTRYGFACRALFSA